MKKSNIIYPNIFFIAFIQEVQKKFIQEKLFYYDPIVNDNKMR